MSRPRLAGDRREAAAHRRCPSPTHSRGRDRADHGRQRHQESRQRYDEQQTMSHHSQLKRPRPATPPDPSNGIHHQFRAPIAGPRPTWQHQLARPRASDIVDLSQRGPGHEFVHAVLSVLVVGWWFMVRWPRGTCRWCPRATGGCRCRSLRSDPPSRPRPRRSSSALGRRASP